MSVRERIVLLTQPTFTVGVSGVVLSHEREVLLLRNRFRYSSSWQLPGGFLKRGEQPEDGLARELREETGLQIVVEKHLETRLARRQHLDVCYRCRVTGGMLDADPREILDAGFFPPNVLPPGVPKQHRTSIEAAMHE